MLHDLFQAAPADDETEQAHHALLRKNRVELVRNITPNTMMYAMMRSYELVSDDDEQECKVLSSV